MSVLLKLYMGKMWTFLKPIIYLFMSKVGTALAAAATQAVAVVAESAITGDKARRDEAFKLIETDLKRQGFAIGAEVTTYMINLAIESAVAGMKK